MKRRRLVHSAEVQPFRTLSTTDKIIGLITYLLRFAAGAVFIYSGFVKAVDPWGTIYKLREYLAVMQLPWLNGLTTTATFLLFGFEFLVGISLIVGAYRRWAPGLATLFMSCMLALTLWIALENPVSDCGCFGDAIVLSNWATFWKNVVLLVVCVWLLKFNSRIRCIIIPTVQIWAMCASIAYIVVIGWIGYIAQPLIDYRQYPIGVSLMADDSDEQEMLSVWSDGTTTVTLPADSIPEGEKWTFVDRVGDKAASGSHRGLAIYDAGEDVTDDVITDEGEQVVVLFPDIIQVSIANYYKLNSLYAFAQEHDIDLMAIGAGDADAVADFRDLSLAEYPIYTAEDTAIKEVARGNPAVVYMRDGKIVWKNSLQAIPTDDFMDGSTHDMSQYTPDNREFLMNLTFTYICIMLVIMLLSHIPMLMRKLRHPLQRFRSRSSAALILLIAASTLLTGCKTHDEPPVPPEKSTKLTLLVYMVANNNLYTYSRLDINEIIEGYELTPAGDVNILVYYVQPYQDPKLLVAERGAGGVVQMREIRTYPEGDVSLTKARVSEVIADVIEYAPADDYGVFFWSHATNWLPATNPANGPTYSYGEDGGKQMNITDLAEAVPDGLFKYIWMDCCLMGSTEVAYQFKDKCEFYVSSPTEVLNVGAPYQVIIPALAGSGVIEAAEREFKWYADNSDSSMHHFTISVVDTSGLTDLAEACRNLFLAGNGEISIANLQAYGRKQNVSFYDAEQTFNRYSSDTDPHAALAEAMNKAVIYKGATPRMLSFTIDPAFYSGLSTTIPFTLINSNQINLYHELDWYKAVYAR